MCLDFARHSKSLSSRSILQILFLLQKPEVILLGNGGWGGLAVLFTSCIVEVYMAFIRVLSRFRVIGFLPQISNSEL